MADWERRGKLAAQKRAAANQQRSKDLEYIKNRRKQCYDTFFVNYCLLQTREEEIKRTRNTRKILYQANSIERRIAQEEFEAKEAYRLRESEWLEAELAIEAADNAKERARLQAEANATAKARAKSANKK